MAPDHTRAQLGQRPLLPRHSGGRVPILGLICGTPGVLCLVHLPNVKVGKLKIRQLGGPLLWLIHIYPLQFRGWWIS